MTKDADKTPGALNIQGGGAPKGGAKPASGAGPTPGEKIGQAPVPPGGKTK